MIQIKQTLTNSKKSLEAKFSFLCLSKAHKISEAQVK